MPASTTEYLASVPQAGGNAALSVHYFHGYLQRDVEAGFVRLYPDILAARFYLMFREQDLRDLVPWSESEIATLGVFRSDKAPYVSVGVEFDAPYQVVKIKNRRVGDAFMKALVGLTPARLRALESLRGLRMLDIGDQPQPINGGGSDAGHDGPEPAGDPGHVTSGA